MYRHRSYIYILYIIYNLGPEYVFLTPPCLLHSATCIQILRHEERCNVCRAQPSELKLVRAPQHLASSFGSDLEPQLDTHVLQDL